MHIIDYNNKTKAVLISELSAYGNYEGSVWPEKYFKYETKKCIIKRIKVYNANVTNGGNGNFSEFKNDEAFLHINSMMERLQQYLLNKLGVNKEGIEKLLCNDLAMAEAKKYQLELDAIRDNDYEGFIGHGDVKTFEEKYASMLDSFIDKFKHLL